MSPGGSVLSSHWFPLPYLESVLYQVYSLLYKNTTSNSKAPTSTPTLTYKQIFFSALVVLVNFCVCIAAADAKVGQFHKDVAQFGYPGFRSALPIKSHSNCLSHCLLKNQDYEVKLPRSAEKIQFNLYKAQLI